MEILVTTQTGKQLTYNVQQGAELADLIHIGSYHAGAGGLAYLVLSTNKIVLVPNVKVETVATKSYATLGAEKGDLITVVKPAQPLCLKIQDGNTHWGVRDGKWCYCVPKSATKDEETETQASEETDSAVNNSADEAF